MMNAISREEKKQNRKIPIMQVLVLGYAVVILIGTVLLWLPMSSRNAGFTPFFDAFFTAVSATCITGLTVVHTGTYWSNIGEIIILLLMQIGALGFMSFATLLLLFLGRKITLRQRLLLQQGINGFDLSGLVRLTKYILIFTLSVELLGACILATQFIPEYGLARGIWYSVFHSVSAFCNAGFDLIETGTSLSNYAHNPVVIYTMMLLIIIGGLGFFVWTELFDYPKKRKLSFHSKLVLSTTIILTITGAVLIGAVEFYNPHTLKDMSFFTAFNNVLFTSVTTRTAGFTTIPFVDFTGASTLVIFIFIFIGGSPGSTAGGIKNTTIAVLFLSVWSFIKGRPYIEAFGRRIRLATLHRSVVIFVIGMAAIILTTFIILITDSQNGLLVNAFEMASAFGTTGISLGGVTAELSIIGKCIVMVMMFLGRVGPLTLGLALASNQKVSPMKYPEGRILIG